MRKIATLEIPLPHFRSDEEYLVHLEAIFLTRLQLQNARESAFVKLTELGSGSARSEVASLNVILLDLSTSLQHLETTLAQRLAAELPAKSRLPRLERLVRKLQVTRHEELAIQYIVLHNVGTHFPPPDSRYGTLSAAWPDLAVEWYPYTRYERRGMLRNMALLCNMTSREVLDFLSPNRAHIKVFSPRALTH